MDKLGKDGAALLAELRESNQKLAGVPRRSGAEAASGLRRRHAAGARKLVEDPNLASTIAHLQRILARLDRIVGGSESDLTTTLENLRQISDNLRDLTENAKRYPSGVLLGEPPLPAKGAQ